MNSNSAFPFTNSLLRQSFARETEALAAGPHQRGSENEQTRSSICSHPDQSLGERQRNRCEETPQFSRIKGEECETEAIQSREESLQELLNSSDHDEEPSIREQPSFSRDNVLAQILDLNAEQSTPVREREEGLDYSKELKSLKQNMAELERMAQGQIVKLKRQLQEQRQLRANLEQKTKKEARSIGTNTEFDCRDEQISVLKESLLRHVELNKQLLRQEIKDQENMQSLINKVVL